MSDKGVIKELGLEKYFWTILDSSQDAKSGSSSNSLSRRSQHLEETVEKKRGEAIEQEIEAKPLSQEKNENVTKIKILDKLKTPSQEPKPFFGSPSLFNGGSPDNDFISKASLTASGRKSPFMNFGNPPTDAGFIEFDPQPLQSTQKNAKSDTSPAKETFSNVEPVVKIKFTPAAEEEKFVKQRSNSFDEADFEMISQILEEDAKKSGNEEGTHTAKSLPGEHEENNKDLEENTRGFMPTLQTASLKPIAQRSDALARAQAMFANEDDEFGGENFFAQDDKNNESPRLQTASFKNIPIRKENLDRGKNMFADDNDDFGFGFSTLKNENSANENMSNNDMPMLQTASFKPISINQENLSRAQNMFGDADNEGQNFPAQGNNNNTNDFQGLQTASFKPLHVKQEAKSRVQNMFADDEEEDELSAIFKKNKNRVNNQANVKANNEPPKLQTASFKSASTKQENVTQFKNMFAKDEEEDELSAIFKKNKNRANNQANVKVNESTKSKTAPFKMSPIKQETNSRLQNMFAKEEEGDELSAIFKKNKNRVNNNVNTKVNDSPKLQTASFKNIPIKKENLDASKKMFADDNDDLGFGFGFGAIKNENSVSENFSNNDMPMLQTASFKPISIKQENLDRMQNMFADVDNEGQNFFAQDNSNTDDFQGIQTASFKTLSVKQEVTSRGQNMSVEGEEDDELSAIFKKNKNRVQQKPTTDNNSTLSRINNLFTEDTETSTGFKKQVVNNSKVKDQLADTTGQNPDAFSRLASQRSFSFRNSIKESLESEMEIEPKLTTASFKPIAIDESKLKRIKNMLSDDEDTNMFPLGENSNKSGNQSKMTVEDNSSFRLLTKEDNSKDNSSSITKYSLKQDDTKKFGSKKVISVEKPKFDRVKNLQPDDKEVRSTDNNEPEITYKPLPPLIKSDENTNLSRESDFLENAFNQLNQSQSNSNFEVSLQTGGGKKVQFSDSNLEDAFKYLTADSQDETTNREPLPEKLEVEEEKSNKESVKISSAPSPPLANMQQTKKVLKQDLRVQKTIKKIKLNTENLKIPDRVLPEPNKFLIKSSTDAKSVKKNQGFKFTKENTSSNGNSPQPVEKTKPLKRSFNEVSKENKGIEFPKNPKVQAYNLDQDAKARKLIKSPKKSYFSFENLNRNLLRVSNEIKSISVKTALDRKFICPCTESFSSQADLSNPLTDDVCYCNGNLLIGWNEMMQELLKDGLEQNHLKEAWVKNHYRNIVWKLASIERRLCNFHPTKHLTADNVKKELEYRYYVEYVEGKRSVIQKILEKDESSTGHLILLVGEIIKKTTNKKNSFLVELTDGWYSVYFEIKPEESIKNDKKVVTNNQLFFLLVSSKKLCSGMKLHVVGMKIISGAKPDSKQEPANPEEASTKTMVELDYNSVNRASWDAKLGLARSMCFPKSLLSVRNHGGAIPMIDVFVIKKYKLLEKTGGNVKQYQPQEEGSGTKGKVFLKIRVGDAIIYHDPKNPQKYQEVFCEIDISGVSDEEFGQIKENERIRFYNLKSISNPEKNQPYYDNEKKKHFNHCLYLEFLPRTSRYQTASTMGATLRQDANKFKEFAKENYKSYYFLTSLELNSPNLFNFYQKEIRFCRNEIDMIGLVIETTPSKIFGCIGNGHFFQISLHSRPFFSNIKILDKKNTIINFRALQVHSIEKLGLNEPCCFFLRTNDYTSFGNLPSTLQSEAENLDSILKDQTKLENYREKINMIMKKY